MGYITDILDREAWIAPASNCFAEEYFLDRFAGISTPYGVLDYENFCSDLVIPDTGGCPGAHMSGGIINGGYCLGLLVGRYNFSGAIDRGVDKISIPLESTAPYAEMAYTVLPGTRNNHDMEFWVVNDITDFDNAYFVRFTFTDSNYTFDIDITVNAVTTNYVVQGTYVPGLVPGRWWIRTERGLVKFGVDTTVIDSIEVDIATEATTLTLPYLVYAYLSIIDDTYSNHMQVSKFEFGATYYAPKPKSLLNSDIEATSAIVSWDWGAD